MAKNSKKVEEILKREVVIVFPATPLCFPQGIPLCFPLGLPLGVLAGNFRSDLVVISLIEKALEHCFIRLVNAISGT